MTKPKVNKNRPRYSVFEGTAAVFIVDDFEAGKDPVVSMFNYAKFQSKAAAIRYARIECARMNRLSHYGEENENR